MVIKKNYYIKCFFIMIFLGTLLFIFNSALYSKWVSAELSEDVLRLHVIANSNSKEDQEIKYIVRDAILNYMNTLLTKDVTKQEAILILNENLSNFKSLAIETLNKNGFSYSVKIEVGNFNFPTKHYGDVSLPAGYYDALKITLGEGNGENWWCVMFPPLCFVSIDNGTVPDESKEILQKNLTEESYHLITDDSQSVKVKFKIVELIESHLIF